MEKKQLIAFYYAVFVTQPKNIIKKKAWLQTIYSFFFSFSNNFFYSGIVGIECDC